MGLVERKRPSRSGQFAKAKAPRPARKRAVNPTRVMIAPQHVWTSVGFHKMIDSVTAGVIENAQAAGAKITRKIAADIRQSVMANFNSGIIPAGNA